MSDSLLDILTRLPSGSFFYKECPVTNKEASLLFDIWENDCKNTYRNASSGSANQQMNSLVNKGYIIRSIGGNIIITSKGKDVIRKIILYSEKSSFDKEKQVIEYDKVFQKTASKISIKNKLNWLQKTLN